MVPGAWPVDNRPNLPQTRGALQIFGAVPTVGTGSGDLLPIVRVLGCTQGRTELGPPLALDTPVFAFVRHQGVHGGGLFLTG